MIKSYLSSFPAVCYHKQVNKFPFFTFLGIFILGLVFAAWYGRKTRHFKWSEYFAMLALPSAALIWLTYTFGTIVLTVYLGSAILGPFLEWILGWSCYRTLGARLWEYKRLSISGHTSVLVIPFWGIVGIIFLLFVTAFNP